MDKKGKIVLITALVLVGILLISLAIAKPGRAPRAKKECNDKIDNDGDGAVDLADTGCDNKADNDETDCGDGVCEGGETPANCALDCGEPDSCSDTDGGNVITVFGTTSGYYGGDPYSNDDYCVDVDNIMEYYCSGDYEQSEQQSCGTDGYGSNYCFESSVYRDYIDYFCSNGECDSTATPELVEECTYGCTNGVCDPIPDSCSDTDGGYIPPVQGTVHGYFGGDSYEYSDYCYENETMVLIEYYCNGDQYAYDWYECNSTCVEGACT